jgi:hypothetical protein
VTADEFVPLDAERAVIGSIMQASHLAEKIVTRIQPDDFGDPHLAAVAALMWRMHADGETIDPQTFGAALHERRPVPVDRIADLISSLFRAAWNPLSASVYADEVVKAARRRRLRDIGINLQQYAATADPDELALDAFGRVEAVVEDRGLDNDPSPSVDYLANVTITEDWIFPRVLERQDRLLITAPEGGGKSVMVRQLAMCAAVGIHPFTGAFVKPRRVLMIDCENNEAQSKKHLMPLLSLAERLGAPHEGRFRIQIRNEGLDLTRPQDAAWLLNRATVDRPEVLCIGPLYQLHRGDLNDERDARAVARALNAARLRANAALITETHAGHGAGLHKERDLRPKGSQLWRAWPEMIRAIRPSQENERFAALERAGRNDRDRRYWPEYLRWGDIGRDEWPWVEISPDEYDGAVGKKKEAA